MAELILSGGLGAALVGIGLWVYFGHKEIHGIHGKILTLATETREALSDNVQKISGLRDHIALQNTNISLMEKELAEFAKNMDADMIAKLQDRVALVEMSNGVRRFDSSKKNG